MTKKNHLLKCLTLVTVTGAFFATAMADDDAVLTETGAPLKVVVRHDAAIYEGPAKSGRSRPVEMFRFFYVLKPDRYSEQHTKNDFYRIATGPSRSQELGWLHKDVVVEWSHRQALGLRPSGDRERASFFKSKRNLRAAYSGGAAPDPLSREPKGGTLDINLVPILERFEMESDGDEVDGYRVAYLHSRNARGSVRHRRNPDGPAIDLSKATLDVVFVVDTTSSMGPHIEAAKQAVAKIAREIATRSKGAEVRFGLVGYRDVGDVYVTRLFANLESGANHDRFQTTLESVDVDGGGDGPEEVFGALKMAVTSAGWNPHAFKHIILMGDAPAHTEVSGEYNPQRLSVEGVVALAQPRGQQNIREKITLHAIYCKQSASIRTAVEQFKGLAAGSEYPGVFGEFDTSSSPGFIEELVLKAVGGLDAAKSGADVRELRDTPGLGLLVEMVNASETVSDVPSFASGYCCEVDTKGNQVFEPYVLVQHGRLGMFNAFLDFSVKALRTSGDPGSRDVKKMLKSIQIFATQLNLDEPIDADIPLTKIANYILGFPVRNDIFDMTFRRLAAMSEADFESWVRKVEASRTVTQSHLDNSRIWRSLGRDDDPLEQRYCFLKVNDLP